MATLKVLRPYPPRNAQAAHTHQKADSTRQEPRGRDQIIAAHPIEGFVRSRGFELRQEGNNFTTNGCAVQRHEKPGHRPVTLYTENSSWYCHDCKKGGSVIDWMMLEKGCDAKEAMRLLGQDVPSPRIVATYNYPDEEGNLLYRCLRWHPKDFSQQQPDGQGGWINNIKGVRRVLYRLPELLHEIRNGLTIFIAEGEKDVEALRSHGLPATCNPFGAGKWRDEYSAFLRGADVVIIADKDKDGRAHAQDIAAKSYEIASSIRVIELPEKDAALFFENGGDAKQLLEIASPTPQWIPKGVEQSGVNGSVAFSFDALMEFDPANDPNCMIGHRWLVKGGSTLWAAGAGYGKSALALQLAIYWGCGQQIFGLRPRHQLKSLILQAENDLGDCAEQMQGVLRGISATGDFDIEKCKEAIKTNVIIHQVVGKSGQDFVLLFEQLLFSEHPDIAWIDPLFAFAGCDLLNPKETGHFLRELLFPLAIKRGIGLQVIHHAGKPQQQDDGGSSSRSEIDYQYLGFGTSEIMNAFRAVNILVPIKDSDVFKLVMSKRGERSGTDRAIYLTHSRDSICWMQAEKPETKPKKKMGRKVEYIEEDVLEYMSYTEGVKATDLFEHVKKETGMEERTFWYLWKDLKKANQIKVDQEELWYRK